MLQKDGGGGRVVRRCWVNFQCQGVLLTWITVGQGPIVLAVGAGGGCLDIFSLIYHFSFLTPSLWETARYRLKYCLKGPLSPKQPTKNQKDGESPVRIQPGYYSFQQLADIFHSHKISMSVNETNGRVTLSTPSELKISKRLKSMLGFQVKGRFFPKQTYQGERPLDFAVIKSLYVHLSDINESHNYHNVFPSDVLAVIPIENKSFGDIVTVRLEHPEFKRLTNGAITELKLVVKDENNTVVDNHGLPMSCVLDII